MNNELIIKQVEFNGNELMAVQNQETQKIYVGVSYVCNGLGLNKSQKDTQVQNIQHDIVLKNGCLKFQAGIFDPNNETLSIELDCLPLWLAKIAITPAMQKENVKLVEKLIDYQLKAKDVLFKAFIKKEFLIPRSYSEALRLAADLQEQNEKLLLENKQQHQKIEEMQPKETYYDLVLKSPNAEPITIIAKDYGLSAKKLNQILHELKIQYKMRETWLLYNDYSNKGYTKSSTYIVDQTGESKMRTNWTQKGRLFIYDLLKNKKNIFQFLAKYSFCFLINHI